MRLYPTRPTLHVALAGTAFLVLGIATRSPAVCAFGASIILAVAIGRAFALLTVTHLRESGFEMVWRERKRMLRTSRGGEIAVGAELRNRSADDMRAVSLRAVASSMLSATIVPSVVDLPAHSRIFVHVNVAAKRVGRWGLHGMALEVLGVPAGGEGLYEVPLMFANPFGIEVLPHALRVMLESPLGGRARRGAHGGRPMNAAGDSEEFRELRDHVPGDPFKAIAWRASARRGKLVVREMEHEQREVVWLLVDASVELWAGPLGEAPLDLVVDEVAAVAARHLARTDRVGLSVFASRPRTWLLPSNAPNQAAKIAGALASCASAIDSDRSGLVESEVAARVAEHARPLDPKGLGVATTLDLDALAARAEVLRNRAPFAPRVPFASTPRERTLRHYLASFGIEGPPRAEGEAHGSQLALTSALEKLAKGQKAPTRVIIWSPPPTPSASFASALRRLKNARVEIRWRMPAPAVVPFDDGEARTVKDAIVAAVRTRAAVGRVRGESMLRRLGVQVVHPRRADAMRPHLLEEEELRDWKRVGGGQG